MSRFGKIAAVGLGVLAAAPAFAQTPDQSQTTPTAPDLWASVARSANLLGDMGGLRTWSANTA